MSKLLYSQAHLFTDEEFKRFLADNFPAWRRQMITVGFHFDLKGLQGTEGLPEAAREMVQSQDRRFDILSPLQKTSMIKMKGWTSKAYGMMAEFKVTKMLERIFYTEPCCLLSGFVENQLLNVAKEALEPGYSISKKNDEPLSAKVRLLSYFTHDNIVKRPKYFCLVSAAKTLKRFSRKFLDGWKKYQMRMEG